MSRAAPSGESEPGAEPRIDFVLDIRPIFEASCFTCHGAEKQMAELRLDSRRSALEGGKSGPAILPGNGAESLLYRKAMGSADGSRMPLAGDALGDTEIKAILGWIDQGAGWPDELAAEAPSPKKHWAYVKPSRPEPPAVKRPSWVRNPIDSFILSRLEKEGLEPSPEASRVILIRRLTLDLIGLPPTLDEVDAFVADSSPDAYEKVVDRLLASPHYGERWAKPWLDLARYADTGGYIHDRRRSIWPYRDWVIRALNADMPFNQFTLEQLAGDLLPDATPDQKVATGFHRNTMINTEGGVDADEYRVAAVFDRVDTTATVWLGTTLGCAQCHDHKYDPLTQEEYYRLFAFFNNTEEEINRAKGIGPSYASITLPPLAHLASHRPPLEEEIARLEVILKSSSPELEAAQAEWESEVRGSLVSWIPVDPILSTSAAGARLVKLEDGSLLAEGITPGRDTYLVTAETAARRITAFRLETLTHSSLPHGGSSRSSSGDFILTGFEVSAAPLNGASRSRAVAFDSAVEEYALRGSEAQRVLDGDPVTGWSIGGSKESLRVNRQAIFIPESPVGFDGGTRLTVRLRHESEKANQIIGRFRFWVTEEDDPGRHVTVPSRVERILALERRTDQQQRIVTDHYRSIDPSLEPVRKQLSQARAFWRQLTAPSSLVMKELEKPRTSHLFIKGSFLNKGRVVTPGVPAVLHPLPDEEQPDRLTLARWLVDGENPLVGRVTMNRLWMHHFGRALVETPEDFGSQGAPPTHPELLDWLATEFLHQGWSLKAMHRLVVASATYRQGSRVTSDLRERDPYNQLYARGPRFRMEAEAIRDNALKIAGLLSPKMYGPSAFPPQPEGLWENLYVPDEWVTSQGADRYRRGIYTFVKRIVPYPFFANFDVPSRETICVRRTRTNTPLQALNLWNDPVFLEAARALAGRMIKEGREEIEERIGYGIRLCLARPASAQEIEELTGLFHDQQRRFEEADQLPAKWSDEEGSATTDDVGGAELTAWTAVAQVLLNLDETVTRP